MGAVASCRVCHLTARALLANGPLFQDMLTSLDNRRWVSEVEARVKSRQ